MLISNRESIINAKATAKWKDALEAINNDQFENFIMSKFGNFAIPQMPEFVSTSTAAEIDYEKLAIAVASKMQGIIPAPAQVTNNIDGDGLHSFVQKGSDRIEIKNKRFSMQ